MYSITNAASTSLQKAISKHFLNIYMYLGWKHLHLSRWLCFDNDSWTHIRQKNTAIQATHQKCYTKNVCIECASLSYSLQEEAFAKQNAKKKESAIDEFSSFLITLLQYMLLWVQPIGRIEGYMSYYRIHEPHVSGIQPVWSVVVPPELADRKKGKMEDVGASWLVYIFVRLKSL